MFETTQILLHEYLAGTQTTASRPCEHARKARYSRPARWLHRNSSRYLAAFLRALTDPVHRDAAHLVPQWVPSGLPVED